MTAIRILRNTAIALLLALSFVGAAQAARMVSICAGTVNMRAGPGTSSEVRWELGRHYPLQVLKQRGAWLKVRDFEGDVGWVSAKLTCKTPYMIVKGARANIRSGPGIQYRRLGKLEYGEVLKTLEKRGRWVRVRYGRSGAGWVARSLLWGG